MTPTGTGTPAVQPITNATVTAAMVADLRDMTAEPAATTYSDDDLAAVIVHYPLTDATGHEPVDLTWTPTYDLNAAAANLWGRKRAALAAQYDFTADGGIFHRSQAFDAAGKMARYYAARRAPSSIRVHVARDAERDLQSTYWTDGGRSDLVIGAVNAIRPEEDA